MLRDAQRRAVLEAALAGAPPVLSRFTQLELLAGCRDQGEWDLLAGYLEAQDYVELQAESWAHATRIELDLRRRTGRGREAPSPIACCVAQLAIDHDLELLHRDPDFEAIARVRNLKQRRLDV